VICGVKNIAKLKFLPSDMRILERKKIGIAHRW